MPFQVVYVADGFLNTVRKVKYVDRIRNFAYLSQPYNKMKMMNVPALKGVYELQWRTPDEEMELYSIVVTCSGYGECDFFDLWVGNEHWYDTWFPTEVKEGLFVGTNTYVRKIEPKTSITLKFTNTSGTSKTIWLGIRLIRDNKEDPLKDVRMPDVESVAEPILDLDDLLPENPYFEADGEYQEVVPFSNMLLGNAACNLESRVYTFNERHKLIVSFNRFEDDEGVTYEWVQPPYLFKGWDREAEACEIAYLDFDGEGSYSTTITMDKPISLYGQVETIFPEPEPEPDPDTSQEVTDDTEDVYDI